MTVIERTINKLPAKLQERMARYVLAGWRFVPEPRDEWSSGSWDAYPPGVDHECIGAGTLRELLTRMGEPDEDEGADGY